MSIFRAKERERAVQHGLEFIYGIACQDKFFSVYGHDLINCFYFISATSRDKSLRQAALEMGRERARRWRRLHARLPEDASAEDICEHIHGLNAASRLGFPNPALKEQLRRAARRVTPREYFWFDPTTEPPPRDMTYPCRCGLMNERGRKTCKKCRARLEAIGRYKLWYEALIAAYNAERVGVRVGARFTDLLKWLPKMRPYRGHEGGLNPDFYDTLYAVTHIVYTLNHYSLYRLRPNWLPEEFKFLKANLWEAARAEDPDMMGEFLDSLRAFGLEDTHPLIRKGMGFLLSRQNADGSWGDTGAADVYERYHPTWTAVDGLRDYAWRGERLSFPGLMPMLRAMNRRGGRVLK